MTFNCCPIILWVPIIIHRTQYGGVVLTFDKLQWIKPGNRRRVRSVGLVCEYKQYAHAVLLTYLLFSISSPSF